LNILLLGGTGQLGRALRHRLAGLGQVIAPPRRQCDVRDAASLRQCVDTTHPAVIVNAAAYTDVDGAEDAPDVAMAVNAHGPALLAEAADACGALLVHYCSDYVYDGTLGRPYVETEVETEVQPDAPNPVNVYGRSKLAGSRAASQAGRHLILRVGWLYSVHGRNFLKTMVARLMQGQRVRVVDDQFGAPTSVALLADVTAQLLARYLCGDSQFPFGTYHVAAAGYTSWYGYAKHIAGRLNATDILEPTSSAERPTRARRPLDTRLDTTRLRDTFGVQIPPWEDDVTRTLDHFVKTNPCTP